VGVESGKIDRATRMTVESLTSSEADLEGSNRWYTVQVHGASGKDIRQLFERQGVLVSRVLRVSAGSLKLEKTLARGRFRQLTPEETTALLAPPAKGTEGQDDDDAD
jgi:16S rRNA U516 pseudouridylate synthase RsuA-like enzyme